MSGQIMPLHLIIKCWMLPCKFAWVHIFGTPYICLYLSKVARKCQVFTLFYFDLPSVLLSLSIFFTTQINKKWKCLNCLILLFPIYTRDVKCLWKQIFSKYYIWQGWFLTDKWEKYTNGGSSASSTVHNLWCHHQLDFRKTDNGSSDLCWW